MRATRAAVLAVCVLAVTPAAQAGPPGSWSAVARGGQSSTSQVGAARAANGTLHVVWQRQSGLLSHDLLHTPVSPAGAAGPATPIVTGWVGVLDAALAVRPGGELLAFFSGQRTVAFDEPLFGLNLATSTSGGSSWSLTPASIYREHFAYARTPSVALVGGVPLQVWYGVAEPVVHAGLDPASPAHAFHVSGEALNENLVADGGSSAVVAWCQGISGQKGFFAQRVDTGGRPAGAAMRMPGSATSFQGAEHLICPPTTFRTALAARAGGGVFLAGLTGYPARNAVRVWRVGSGSAPVVAGGSRLGDGVALAADASGRLWLAWTDGTSVRVRRSNRAATLFGEPVTVRGPAGQAAAYTLDALAQGDRLDVLARFGTVANEVALFHTQVHPGLTLRATGGRPVRFRVTDAGDPVAGATVRVGGRAMRTNAQGVASVALPRGSYRAVASKARYVPDTAAVSAR